MSVKIETATKKTKFTQCLKLSTQTGFFGRVHQFWFAGYAIDVVIAIPIIFSAYTYMYAYILVRIYTVYYIFALMMCLTKFMYKKLPQCGTRQKKERENKHTFYLYQVSKSKQSWKSTISSLLTSPSSMCGENVNVWQHLVNKISLMSSDKKR